MHANSSSEKRLNNTEKNPQDLVVSGSVKDGENRWIYSRGKCHCKKY